MERKSKYSLAVLAITAGFFLFCAGRFSSRLDEAHPYRVSAVQHPQEVSWDSSPEDAGGYPESLLPGEVINVNIADIYELQRLPGIGEKRAQDIIAFREEHGPFQAADELDNVPGIGPGILEGLRDYVTTGSE